MIYKEGSENYQGVAFNPLHKDLALVSLWDSSKILIIQVDFVTN
jgi:hypothetical protein